MFFERRLIYKNKKDAENASKLGQSKEKKDADLATKRKKILEGGKLDRQKIATQIKENKRFFEYATTFNNEKIGSFLKQADKMSLFALQSGGALRRAYELEKDPKKKAELKKKLKENQGYAQMTAMFSRKKLDEKGKMYLEVDYRGVGRKNVREDWEFGIGLGMLCDRSWLKVKVVYPDGRVRIGVRKVPGEEGVEGSKVGYYEKVGNRWVYIATFTTEPPTRVYPLEYDNNWQEGVKKEAAYYERNQTYLRKESRLLSKNIINGRAGLSAEAIRQLRSEIELKGGPSERIIQTVNFLLKRGMRAAHCWNWVEIVYSIAGVKRNRKYRDFSYAGYECGNVHAKKDVLWAMPEGTWIFYNNENRLDKHGNHSMIFIRWVDKKKGDALVASWYGNKPGGQKFQTKNLFGKVTFVAHPEGPKKLEPAKTKKYDQSEYKLPPALSNSEKAKLAAKGITPFEVHMGYRLTAEEMAIYRREWKESKRLARMSIQQRHEIMQQRYRYKDALKDSAEMLGIPKELYTYFVCYADAVLDPESHYNPICVNKRGNKIHLSTASGEYQILNSVWKENNNKWVHANSSDPKIRRRVRWYRAWYNRKVKKKYRINFAKLDEMNINEELPGQSTPYKRTVIHNLYAFKGSRLYKKAMAFDDVFTKLKNETMSDEMRYSYQAYLYACWRNGHGGAYFILKNIRQGIPFPQNKKEAYEYYKTHMSSSDWQYRRGFGDFYTVVRACRVFVKRFRRNLKEMGQS